MSFSFAISNIRIKRDFFNDDKDNVLQVNIRIGDNIFPDPGYPTNSEYFVVEINLQNA